MGHRRIRSVPAPLHMKSRATRIILYLKASSAHIRCIPILGPTLPSKTPASLMPLPCPPLAQQM